MSKFKIGDRVAVYVLDRHLENRRVIATVTQVLPNGQLYTDQEDTKDFDVSMVHPKHCRLLKPKKKPRSVWIYNGPIFVSFTEFVENRKVSK
jgi:hypothetical protein